MTATASGGAGPAPASEPPPAVGLEPVRPRLLRRPVRPVRRAAAARARAPEPVRAVDAHPLRRLRPAPARPRRCRSRTATARSAAGPSCSRDDDPGAGRGARRDPQPRPARPHPHPPPRRQGVHPPAGGGARPRIDGARRPRPSTASRPTAGMDVIADLAFPLPFAVISEMLGIPTDDSDHLRDVSHTLVPHARAAHAPDDDLPACSPRPTRCTGSSTRSSRGSATHPADDLLTALIEVERRRRRALATRSCSTRSCCSTSPATRPPST